VHSSPGPAPESVVNVNVNVNVNVSENVTESVTERVTENEHENVPENVNENVNENENENTDTGIRSFHLAEGPGGFIEAICYLRANANDVYYGMTLIDDTPNSACPGWKKSRMFLEKNPSVKLEYGKDGTGNLLSLDNYLHCCEKYRNSMDLITADGGFDFSSDFNHQEVLAQTLVVSEVLYALSLQKMGGSFVIKIFDTFTRVTVDIIHLLALFYTDVIIIKPNTSRVANSEKYIVCKGFKLPSNMDQVIETFSTFFKKLQSASAATATTVSVGAILKSPELHKLHIIHRIEEVNAILGQQQIENIINTMGLVHGKSSDRIDAYKKSHIQKCIEWCERYNIPYNKQSMSTNTFISSVS
jgi:23S rRNA U2552 (ribose-2'-O)-methylase RlmE/FtsJ